MIPTAPTCLRRPWREFGHHREACIGYTGLVFTDRHTTAARRLHDLDCGDVVTTRRLLTQTAGDDYGLIPAQFEVCLIACERSNETCSHMAADPSSRIRSVSG